MELPPTPVASAEPTNESVPPAPAPAQTNTAVPETPTAPEAVPDTPPASVRTGSILPRSKLTKEDKQKLIETQKETRARLLLLKKIATTFLIVSLGWFFWLQMNLSENNSVLSLFGITENLGQKISNIKKNKKKFTLENVTIENNIKNLQKQLESKNYTRYSKEIRDIREKQLQWYDEIDADGNIIFGLTDAVPRMQEFFNDRNYKDENNILSGKHGDIQIKNLQVSRDGINFSVDGSQILGKVFFLNIEFVEMVNSFPFLKNGKLNQFSRQKNKDDDDSMNFSVKLELQGPDEVDPADKRFHEYLDWLNAKSDTNITEEIDSKTSSTPEINE